MTTTLTTTVTTETAEPSTCGACGADVASDWSHCPVCAAALPGLPAHEPVPTVAVSARLRRAAARVLRRARVARPPSARTALAVAASVALLAAVSVLGAERHVASARQEARRANAASVAAKRRLDAVGHELQATIAQRDEMKRQLDESQGALTDAKSSLTSQGGELDTLKSCLNDIEDLGSAFESNDTAGIRSARQAMSHDCAKAEAIL